MNTPFFPCPKCGKPGPAGTFCQDDGVRIVAADAFGVGSMVAGYVIEQKIGEGGMGEVWKASQPDIKKPVCFKILGERLAQNPQALARFKREAKAVNEIQNRHMVDIFSFGELTDGRPYFIMEFLQGQTLATYLKEKKPLPFSQIVQIFDQICQALQAAHGSNIIHRDLKPDNIYIVLEKNQPPFVKLLDFGIAKLVNDGTMTGDQATFGTPAYMSPEQCKSAKDVDARSDIYSLGIILFEMISGRTPFQEPGDSVLIILERHKTAPPPLLSSFAKFRPIPKNLDSFMLKILSKHPEERPEDCQKLFDGFLNALGEVKNERTIDKDSPPDGRATSKLSKTGFFAGLGVVVLGLVYVFVVAPKPNNTTVTTVPKTDISVQNKTVFVSITTDPDGAKVTLDGHPLGETPFKKEMPYSEASKSLSLSKDGFESKVVELSLKTDQQLEIPLKQVPAIDKSPKKPTLENAATLFTEGKLDEAIAAYRALFASDPNAREVLYGLGNTLFIKASNEYDSGKKVESAPMMTEAAGLLEGVVQKYPQDSEAHHTLAVVYEYRSSRPELTKSKDEDRKKAKASYEACIKIDPKSSYAASAKKALKAYTDPKTNTGTKSNSNIMDR